MILISYMARLTRMQNAFLVEALILQNAGTVIILIASGLLFDVTLYISVYDATCINH